MRTLSLNKSTLLFGKTIDICINPSSRSISEPPNCMKWYWVQSCAYGILQFGKAIVVIFSCVSFNGTLKEFDIVQLAVELWIKNTLMTAVGDFNLEQWSFIEKVVVIFQYMKCTAVGCFSAGSESCNTCWYSSVLPFPFFFSPELVFCY